MAIAGNVRLYTNRALRRPAFSVKASGKLSNRALYRL
jgi:hypothetical protein